jgi:hypothetical protein
MSSQHLFRLLFSDKLLVTVIDILVFVGSFVTCEIDLVCVLLGMKGVVVGVAVVATLESVGMS